MMHWLAFLALAPLGSGAPEPRQADIAWISEGDWCEPETVLALPDDTFLVSNVCDFRQDGSGFLTLLDRNGTVIDWRIVAGLDAPLGMALSGVQLYVVDKNRVKVFRWPGYEPLRTIPLGTQVANDVAVGPDDTVYVTDTARGEVIAITPSLERRVLTGQAQFPGANGIHIDNEDLYVGGERLWHVDLRDNAVVRIGPDWLTDIDGIEQEPDGTLQITPVAGPLVRLTDEPVILGAEGVSSANHGYAPGLGLALIPTGFDNKVIAIRVARQFAAEVTMPGYHWSEIGDGIYLHSAIDPLAGPVDGNSIIIDNGDGVVVIDTHINPAAARAAIEQIRIVIGKPVTHVVNTHWHDDHTNGNHAYRTAWPDAKIVSHRATLKSLEEEWQVMEEQRREAYAGLEPAQILDAAEHLDDADQAAGYRLYAGYVAALKPELPTMELVYPDTVFDDELILDQGEHRIELRWLGPGNTEGDIVAWLPDQGVLITGDLLVAPVPFAFDSPMIDWIVTLDNVAKFDADVIVPGHGPVQHDTQYLAQVRRLLENTVSEVRAAHDGGVDLSALAGAVDLSGIQYLFTNGDPDREFAWRSYFLTPGLRSAWTSLGYAVSGE